MKAKDLEISKILDNKIKVSFTIVDKLGSAVLNDLKALSDEFITVKISKFRKRRTLTQNAYLWTLCDELAQSLDSTAKEVYRLAIRHVGVLELVPVKLESAKRWVSSWEGKGDGWICEEHRESKLEGYITYRCYYGSSVYNTKEQARLIDYIIDECKLLGIPTMSTNEVERLKR